MNKCSFSEDETTHALQASYVPLDPASMIQNNQSLIVSASAPNMVLASRAPSCDALPSGGKKKNLVKTKIEVARQNGVQDLHIKDQKRSGEIRNMKNVKKLPRELDSVRKSGKQSTI